jgi:hypothetical protein
MADSDKASFGRGDVLSALIESERGASWPTGPWGQGRYRRNAGLMLAWLEAGKRQTMPYTPWHRLTMEKMVIIGVRLSYRMGEKSNASIRIESTFSTMGPSTSEAVLTAIHSGSLKKLSKDFSAASLLSCAKM